jgi:hypothetical protein
VVDGGKMQYKVQQTNKQPEKKKVTFNAAALRLVATRNSKLEFSREDLEKK